MLEITIQIKDSSGKTLELSDSLSNSSIVSHDFSQIEGLVEHIRTELLKKVERNILEVNQRDYLEKKSQN